MSPLRPSISRREDATLVEYLECLQLQAVHYHGTLQNEQYEWMEVFLTFPPHIADIEVNAKEALAYHDAAHGEGDNDVPFELTEWGIAEDAA